MFKKLGNYFRKSFNRFYQQRRSRLILDISLIVVILLLTLAVLSLHFYNPKISELGTWLKPSPKKEAATVITEPPIEVTFAWEDKIIKKEETAKILVTVKNTAETAIFNYNLKISSRDNNFSALGELSLSELAAKSEQILPLEIKISENIVLSEKSVLLRAMQSYQAGAQTFKEGYDLPVIKIISDLTVAAAAYYNSPQGDQLGSGPLPPVAGLPTNFWIFLKAEANGNFTNFSLSAKLPKNVELTDNSSLLAGELNYNASARQVVWRVDKIEAQSSEYRAGFEVQLIPDGSQVDNLAVLASQLRFQGEDAFTGIKVEQSLSEINTDLEADALNRGQGKVLPLDE